MFAPAKPRESRWAKTRLEDVLKAHEPGMSPSARRARSAEPLRLVGISADRLDSYPHQPVRWHAAARERLGFPVLFITHDLWPLVESCDRIAIMYGGRIVEEAPASSLYRDSLPPYSDGLPHSFPALRGPRGEPSGIPGSHPDLRAMPAGCAFHPRRPHAFEPCATQVPELGEPDDASRSGRTVARWPHPARA